MEEILRSARVAPSILSADFARLAGQVATVMDAGARIIHVDVMDGHFVPPITIGPLIVDALREQVHDAGGVLEVHLMVERPERHVAAFADAGAANIIVHVEATPHVHFAVQQIREAGCTAGVALTPSTPVDALSELRGELWSALCMTVDPGWGGQSFIPTSLDKIARLRAHVGEEVEVEVDGGIDAETVGPCAAAGASLFVAGTSVFGAEDPGEAFRALTRAAEGGYPYLGPRARTRQ
jgi:ribulose-phosphate 3-epimerase